MQLYQHLALYSSKHFTSCLCCTFAHGLLQSLTPGLSFTSHNHFLSCCMFVYINSWTVHGVFDVTYYIVCIVYWFHVFFEKMYNINLLRDYKRKLADGNNLAYLQVTVHQYVLSPILIEIMFFKKRSFWWSLNFSAPSSGPNNNFSSLVCASIPAKLILSSHQF